MSGWQRRTGADHKAVKQQEDHTDGEALGKQRVICGEEAGEEHREGGVGPQHIVSDPGRPSPHPDGPRATGCQV